MSTKIWDSFGALNNSAEHQKKAADEFDELLPANPDDKGLLDAKTPRRDFLKYLGFSTAAASLAASCEMPVRKAIPYVNKPDNLIPGIANYYATTFDNDGEVLSVVAKVRDGRPIKIEGNELSPVNGLSTSARAQASVLDLYDTSRLRFPGQMKDGQPAEISTFDALDKMIASAMAGIGSGQVVLLSNTITSPSSLRVISEFLAKYPGGRHVQYDAISYSALLQANGRRVLPSYHFDKAKVIVSLGADFLGTWLSPVEFARQYAVGRRFNEQNPAMSKHFQFESILSMTGANADERYTHRPSQTATVASALLAAVGGGATSVADAALKAGIEKAARELRTAGGAALVVSGSNDVNVQRTVAAINQAIGAMGNTISWAQTNNTRQGLDADMANLVNEMNAGRIGALLVLNANPAYSYAEADKFVAGLAKVPVSISFNTRLDETTARCKYVVPSHHYLESWGDAEPKSGLVSFIQPTIAPLFKTRHWQDNLLKWSGSTNNYETYFKEYWLGRLGGQAAYEEALRSGVVGAGAGKASAAGGMMMADSAATLSTARPANNAVPVIAPGATDDTTTTAQTVSPQPAPNTAAPAAGEWEVVLYEKTTMGSGSQAGNPWLQECPDPVTKATWDNYAMISAAAAKDLLGIDLLDNGDADSYEVHPAKPVISIKVGNKELKLPVMIVPGTQRNTIGIALGYGRNETVGVAAKGAGQNAYPLTSLVNGNVSYAAFNATVSTTGDTYKIAQNQVHNNYEGRIEVVKEASLATFRANPNVFKADRDHLVHEYAKESGDYRNEGSLYDPRLNDRPGIHWGMSVDLNTCTGCAACVVACNAENNIPVVGKTEVLRGHDMHWMRIDRYYVSAPDNPDALTDVVFMPMMCQHCDNAPCENVCPVAATNHSSEGLNQMTYNRCIGTRYCANNCPYKVRRFNWADYMGSDSFPDNQVGHISDATMEMQDDLTRMVLNPDVTVRSRGVIEKCSFCVQRLQEGKLTAKKESRPLKDGEVKTACQSACPTNAITFGDANDAGSALTKLRHESPLRMYYALEQIHVLPNVNYLGKIRNTDEVAMVETHAPAAEAEQH